MCAVVAQDQNREKTGKRVVISNVLCRTEMGCTQSSQVLSLSLSFPLGWQGTRFGFTDYKHVMVSMTQAFLTLRTTKFIYLCLRMCLFS